MNILVSNISSYKAIVLVKYIKYNYPNIRIIGLDTISLVKLFHTKLIDQFILVTNINSYIDTIEKIIIENKIKIFIPTHSSEMELLLENKSRLYNTLDYFSDVNVFKTLNDKKSVGEICRELKINFPNFHKDLKPNNYPYVVKPRNSSGSKGVMYVFDDDSYQKAFKVYRHSSDYIVQDYISGTGVGYSIFANKGEIISGHGHKRIAEFPISGGSSVYRENFEDVRLLSIAKKIISRVKWSGFAMLEFKLDRNNELHLIEINPRVWGSINQGLVNGINYFSYILGRPHLETQNILKYRTYLSPLIFLSFFSYLLKFQFYPVRKFLKNFKYNRSDVSLFKDPGAWISLILRAFK